ncbi:alpha/beta fold hydrolase [Mobilicoccus massiliensis]|uniref:alpha/beta fold hydrolase n=1 Tax=Mobilicoccus massiliensis TaxID=1522310 RepID=UPI0006947F57|nr:hypothetical protein [Mobilicoccus massiliensis]
MATDVFVHVGTDRYAAIDFGGEGPDILLVHQLASNAQAWAPLASALTRIGHVVAVDLRGHGLSRLPEDGPDRIAGDLPAVVRELGLTRPLVVLEQDEIIALSTDRLAGLGARGVAVTALSSCSRGEEARSEWSEQVGPDSLDVWHERFGLFASGTPEELEPYLERVVAMATDDWITDTVPSEQFRAYFRRHLDVQPDGWARLPRRGPIALALRYVEQQPHGLDLIDLYDGPLWMLPPEETLSPAEIEALVEYTAGRPDRELRLISGGPVIEGFDADELAAGLADMLAATETGE